MSHISDPISIKHLQLANRLVMPPMATHKSDGNGFVTDEMCAHYQQRARYSGIGLIITEHFYIHPLGRAYPGQASIASDDAIPPLRRLTDCIHREGVKVFAQINHAGSATLSKTIGQTPMGPSPVPHPKQQEELPRAMTVEEIHQTTEWFAQASLRAKQAGFDGVEIHSAHGYLLNQFYSPLMNVRTDEYGPQSVANRTRFHLETVQAVRQAVGEEFPIALRLGGCDYQAGGSTVDDCVQACQILEQGGVDLLDLSGGMNGYLRPGHEEPGYFWDQSIPVRQAVSVPVVLTGGVVTPAQAETLLEENCADLIGVGRAIYKNPRWADSQS